MSRSKRLRHLPDSPSDVTVDQLRRELAHWQAKARFFEQIGQNRNWKEVLKRVRQIEKALGEKLNAGD
jgi:hypothetical protein